MVPEKLYIATDIKCLLANLARTISESKDLSLHLQENKTPAAGSGMTKNLLESCFVFTNADTAVEQ